MAIDSNISIYQIRKTLDELIFTEEIFVNEIGDVIQGYMDRVVHMKEIPKEIFGNIAELYHFNSTLLGNLQKCNAVDDVSHVFIEKSSGFYELYSEYCQNFPKAIEIVKNILKNPLMEKHLSLLQIELNHKLPLTSYLLKPVQRISKYHLFFQNIVKNCDEIHREIARKALQFMTEILKYINQTQHDNTNLYLQNKIVNMDPATFGDLILKDKLFMNSCNSKIYFHIFLFLKVVLITKKRNKSKFLVKIIFKADEAKIIYDISPHHPLTFFIATTNSKSLFQLQAIDFEQKHRWCFHLQRILSPLVTNPVLISELRTHLIENWNENNNEKQIKTDKFEYIIHQSTIKEETCMKFEQIYLKNMSCALKESHFLSFYDILEKEPCSKNTSVNICDKSIHGQVDLPVFISKKSSIINSLEKQDKSRIDFVNHKIQEKKKCNQSNSLEFASYHMSNYLFTLKIPKSRNNLKNKFILSHKEAKCDDVVLDGCTGVYRKLPEKHEIPIITNFEDKMHDTNSYTFLDFFYEDELLDRLEGSMKDFKDFNYYDDDNDDECFCIKK